MSLPLLISFSWKTSRRIFEVSFSQNWANMATNTVNMERTAGSVVVRRVEDDICDIDPTSISRSICVTGFPTGTKSEALIIHFQRKKNGGGDIESITINKRGAAVITFDNPDGEIRSRLLCFWLTGRYGKFKNSTGYMYLVHSYEGLIRPCKVLPCFVSLSHKHVFVVRIVRHTAGICTSRLHGL